MKDNFWTACMQGKLCKYHWVPGALSISSKEEHTPFLGQIILTLGNWHISLSIGISLMLIHQ